MKLTTILSITIISLIITLSFFIKLSISNKNDSIRWKNNYNEIQKESSIISKTFREFKENTTVTQDSLLKLLKIKLKQVERITYIKTIQIIKDTIYIPLVVDSIDNLFNDKKYNLKFDTKVSCNNIKGFIKSNDATSSLNITELVNINDINYIVYQKRNKYYLFGLIPTTFLGRKITTLHVNSTCGITEVLETNIIKEK